MLLFMIEPQLDHGRNGRGQCFPGRLEITLDRAIGGRAISINLVERRPRDQSAPGPGQPLADGIVIGVKKIREGRMKHGESLSMGRQHKRLKKPGRMREMPLDRAGVGHGLNLAVLRAQGLREAFGHLAHGLKACQQRRNGPRGLETR